MKKVITYTVILTYLTVALRPAQAQPYLYGGGQADVPVLAQSYQSAPDYQEAQTQPAPVMAEPEPQYQQLAPVTAVPEPQYQQPTPVAAESQPQYHQPTPAAVSGKPKVAVYVSETSGYSTEEKSALRTAALNTLVRSGGYQVIERSNVIDAELTKQAGGSVDDDQLTAFGRQSGAQFVCVADMTFLRNRSVPRYCSNDGKRYQCGSDNYRDHQVSVRLIDVETAEVLAFGLVEVDIQSGAAITKAVTNAVYEMLGTVQAVKAPNIPKMAVYVTGGSKENRAGNALYSYTLEALFTRSKKLGNFKVIERSEAFTRQIDREQTTQRSGHVDDGQIARLGKQYGIQNILVANMDHAMDNYNISGRIINIESASVDKASDIHHTNNNLDRLSTISTSIVEEMMGLTSEEVTGRKKEAMKRTIIAVLVIIGTLVLVVWLNAKDKENEETVSVK